jgi:N-acetylglucosaminyldiphosphoundecaprenol N-acetyl-beta-D-mannosaminyltransferase
LKILLNKNITLHNFSTREDAVVNIYNYWKNKSYAIVNYIYWANYPLINIDSEYCNSLLQSSFLLPDGIGMYLYVKKILNIKLLNLNGTDLNPLLIDYLLKNNIEVAFYGASQENVSESANKIMGIYYFQNGYSSLDWTKIKDNSALFVGLGSPKQENWASQNIEIIKSKKLLVVTVGGFFDVLSGYIKRPPVFIRKINMEWAYLIFKRDFRKNFWRNLRNIYIFHYILRDRKRIQKYNQQKLNF